MQKKKQTNVILTRCAQQIKDEWAFLGVREILSVGLELFDALNDVDKMAYVKRVSAEDAQQVTAPTADVPVPKKRKQKT